MVEKSNLEQKKLCEHRKSEIQTLTRKSLIAETTLQTPAQVIVRMLRDIQQGYLTED
jgi:hypothetical protein